MSDHILAGLNEEQLAAVTNPARLLCIRAGAGSGKTRVLTRRIAYGAATDAIDARRVLAVTFTRKAARELNHRLAQLQLRQSAAAGTFHSIALAQLQRGWTENSERAPTLLDRKLSFVARLIPRATDRTTALDVVSEIEWAKARRVTPERYAEAARRADRGCSLEPAAVANIYDDYEKAKLKRNLIDFDDILMLCGRRLQRDRSAAAAFRWKFRHVFVDEFQDVNPLQFALLKVFVGDEPDLCVVGDSRQAIYGWNGADSSYLDEFETHFPGAESVGLRRNYRSTPEILRCASAILPRQGALEPTQPSGPAPTISSHSDDRAEARAISRQLRDTHSTRRRWSDMAVLVRTNAQVLLVAEACAKLSVPVTSRTDLKLLERAEIQDAIDQLTDGSDALAIGLDDLSTRVAEGRDGGRLSAEHADIVEAFIRLGRDHLAVDPNATITSFVDSMRAGSGQEVHTGGDAVDITTFHAAKGLEWQIVHIAGMERGLSPIGHAKTPEALAEENRLIYVALTRARTNLHLHWAQQRTFGDRVSNRSPSPLLDTIAAAARGEDVRTRRKRSAKKAAEARASVSSRNGGRQRDRVADDDPILVALKKWRTSMAKANGVPAFIIFHDDTLHAIAHDKPSSTKRLAALPGLGPVKVARYGDDLLRLVDEVQA